MSETVSREGAKARREIKDVAAIVVDTALQLHRKLAQGCWKPFMKQSWPKGKNSEDFWSKGKSRFPSVTRAFHSTRASGWICLLMGN